MILTKSTDHPSVLNINRKYDCKTVNNYQLEHNMCLLYCAFMSYLVIYLHGTEHHMHLHYCEYQLLMRRNGAWHFIVMMGSPNICYLTQLRIPWKYSQIHFQQFLWVWNITKADLAWQNLIIDINATIYASWFVFANIWNADITNVGFINMSIFVFIFPYGSEDFIWYIAHWSEVAWMFSFFVKAFDVFLLNHGRDFELLVINVLDFSDITFLFVYPAGFCLPLCWAHFMVLCVMVSNMLDIN